MYLTKIEIPLQSRLAADCLRNRQKMHALITRMFNSSQSDNHIQYRIRIHERILSAYIYSDSTVVENINPVRVVASKNIGGWIDGFQGNFEAIFFRRINRMGFRRIEPGRTQVRLHAGTAALRHRGIQLRALPATAFSIGELLNYFTTAHGKSRTGSQT